ICPANKLAECQPLIERLKMGEPAVPADFLNALLEGPQGLFGRCGGYMDGYSKDSPEVFGCVMGHLRNPNIVFPPTLFLWAKGLPAGAKPRSLKEALRMKRETAPQAPPPLPPPPAPPVPPAPPDPQHSVILEKRLADLRFEFRFVDEWKKVETIIETIRDGALHTVACDWSYKLTQNSDSSYTVEWRSDGNNGKLVFPVVNDQYPKNLVLVVLDKGMQLKLR
ncbi:MAG: hypothetical protein U1D33_01560, partial [bacterium]|nr:hypothetical protein [bacterium]